MNTMNRKRINCNLFNLFSLTIGAPVDWNTTRKGYSFLDLDKKKP